MGSSSGSSGPQRRSGGRRSFRRRPRVCKFCADKSILIDYKLVDVLRRYITESGKIRPRRDTGACARHQRQVARAIKRSRHMALLPFAAERFR
ncbi:MAG: 30S ribosomal protein S18 [Chloroflexi bacterium]|nr:30S ribosomal protein S18 [Chloroflexota bacterium]